MNLKEKLYNIVGLDNILQGMRSCPQLAAVNPLDLMTLLDVQPGWIRHNNLFQLADEEIMQLLTQAKTPSGKVLLVPDRAYFADPVAYEVDGSRLAEFVTFYRMDAGTSFFDGCDFVMISPEQATIWAIHHEELYGVFEFAEGVVEHYSHIA